MTPPTSTSTEISKETKIINNSIPESNIKTIQTPSSFYNNRPKNASPLLTFEEYKKLYKQSINEPEIFFGNLAHELLDWDTDFKKVKIGSNINDSSWFLQGKLNASYNCIDRHVFENPKKPAIIYESDDPNSTTNRIITYEELLTKVSKLSGVLTNSFGIKKGDRVAVYLPMIPEAVITLLAITRIGAIHSVIFAGFSSGSIRDRIINPDCKVIITVDGFQRGGKTIPTKKIVDEALKQCPNISNVLVIKKQNNQIDWNDKIDHWWHEECLKYPGYFPPVSVNSEDPLFILYTSGSTGSPKGVVHTTGGYLLGAAMTTKYVFDLQKDDVLFTGGDIGWITGHTYAVYGPLLLGATTVIFEGTPTYPDFGRFWDIIDKYKVTHFYTAPTALRLLKRAGEKYINNHSLASLRTIASVGEPIAPELWDWYDKTIGRGKCHIADTYWQTESGSHLFAPLAGITPMKPGSCSLPLFGIDPVIVDPVTGIELKGPDVEGVLAIRSSWPSMARTVWGAHQRYEETYFGAYPGLYFTGDGAARDKDGQYWIRGRVDDVVNVSGHRLSTSEIEAALTNDPMVGESAVVGIHDDLTGQAVNAFVSLKSTPKFDQFDDITIIQKQLIMRIRKEIGPFAAPKKVFIVYDLPKTRSGKIMRRVLRKVLSYEEHQLGDLTTLANPDIVSHIVEVTRK